jgi:hypothetical protein
MVLPFNTNTTERCVMTRHAVVLLALIPSQVPVPAFAQNPNAFRYRVIADGHYMNGNLTRWYTYTRLTLTSSNQFLALTLAPSLMYGQAGRVVYEREVLVTSTGQLFPEDQFFGHAIVAYDISKRNKIESRWQSGAGLGMNVIQFQEHSVSLAHAFIYENTHFNVVEGNRTWRSSFRLKGSHHFFDKSIIFSHETYFQPSLQRSDDIRWRATASLEFPITKALSFRTTLDNIHESVVLTGRKQDDMRWTFGVSVGN